MTTETIKGAAPPPPVRDPHIAGLLKQLGHDDYRKREEAHQRLTSIVEDISNVCRSQIAQIRKAASTDPDVHIRHSARDISLAYNRALLTDLHKRWSKPWPWISALPKEYPRREHAMRESSYNLWWLYEVGPTDWDFLYRKATEVMMHRELLMGTSKQDLLKLLKQMEENDRALNKGMPLPH